ncbi:NTE family protein [Motilibacter peucedani]|uniref:NTE family protein n=1 Tax=Motilibacter peucedani TaxID=598650 RepID=A0A420XMT6_9ACTN|nr:patatin-like phospholipase family protein [Motilibacter peucedani]RKS72588.1 NTE family protein [Motilibacter peucedani]
MTEPRRALVLGAGGVLGAAWMTGALCALEQVCGVRPAEAEVLLGTSAGSVLTAMLAAGLTPEHLRDHQRGLPLPPGLGAEGAGITWDHETGTGGWLPTRPAPPPASPVLLAAALRQPGSVPWLTTLWAAMPRGRGDLGELRRAVDDAVGVGRWAPRPGVQVVATDFRTGRRVALDGTDPACSLSEAVAASCAAPIWYSPQRVGGETFVDGGVSSVTSADLLAGRGLDEAYVLAPLAATRPDRPVERAARLERRWRRRTTRRVLAEVRLLAASGTRVVLVTPGPEDLAAMGANLMDPRRRTAVMETALHTTEAALRRRVAP